MFDFVARLFSSDFIPHGHCYLWKPEIVWLHVASDSTIALAYYLIPLTLFYFVRKRRDLPFHWMFLMFAVFILSCGTTHLMDVWTIWHGTYRLAGLIKAVTAASSVATAALLVPLIPRALALSSPEELRRANRQLEREIEERRQLTLELNRSRDELELRVHERTNELARVNELLRAEVLERMRVEQSLRKQASLLELAHDAIIVRGMDDEISYWNSGAEVAYGWHRDEAIGKSAPKLLDSVYSADNPVERVVLDGHWEGEITQKRKDGTTILVASRWALLRDETGKPSAILKINTDITEQRRAKEALRESEERFRLVVEAAPNAMIMVGADGRIALVNSQTEKLFGYDRQALIGQPVDQLVPERFRAGHSGHRTGFFGAPTARAMGVGRDLFGVRRDGSEVPVEIGLNPISSPEGSYVLASIIDITERKISENNLKRSLNEKQSLLQEIHHRVKNNLTIISSLLSMQASAMDDEKAVSQLRDSERRVRSMARIHEQLYQHDDMSSIDLAEYVQHLAEQLFSSYAASPLITYNLDVAATNLTIDQAIPCGLILNELITNALKYAYPDGRGEILIRLRSEGDSVWMTVSDRGVGLPAGFDLKTSKSLGMTIIDALTTQLEGQLEIASPPGSSFTVCFPKRSLDNSA